MCRANNEQFTAAYCSSADFKFRPHCLLSDNKPIRLLFAYTSTPSIDRNRSRRQARLFLTICVMVIAFGRQKRSGVLDCTSLVRIRIYLADLLGTTVFAEKRPRATRLISLDLNVDFLTRLSDTSTNVRERAGTNLYISMASANVTRTILNRSSVQATQILKRHDRHLNGL
jgi:hypothetical protein